MADEGKDKTALLVAALPPPDKLGKSEPGGGESPLAAGPVEDVDPGKAAAFADYEAAPPGSPERMAALEDFIYFCVQNRKG